MADLCANNLEFSVSLHCIREIFGPADWPYGEDYITRQVPKGIAATSWHIIQLGLWNEIVAQTQRRRTNREASRMNINTIRAGCTALCGG